MTSSQMISVVVFASLLGLSAYGIGACALNAEESNSALNSAALEGESTSVVANSTESEEKDYDEIAKSEGRKDWSLAIEKARKVLTELEPDVEFRVVDLEDEMMEDKMHEYKIVFRSENKSCVVTVKQETEDKYTVEEDGETKEKALCTEEEK